MHPCIQIPELLDAIFAHVRAFEDPPNFSGPKNYTRSSRQAFYALARTCQYFCDPALDWLWAGLPNISPLLYLFPLEIWTPDDAKERMRWPHRSLRRLSRPLEALDWTRINSYARRVVSIAPLDYFEDTSYGHLRLDPGFAAALELSRVQDHWSPPLTPNLCSIQIEEDGDADPNYNLPIEHLLGPRLRSLRFRVSSKVFFPNPVNLSTLPIVQSKCPSISHLKFITLAGSPENSDTSTLSAFVCSLKSLELIEIRRLDLSDEALLHITTLPTLMHCVLGQSQIQRIPKLIVDSQLDRRFPVLSTLSVRGWRALKSVGAVLSSLPAKIPLNSLYIRDCSASVDFCLAIFLHTLFRSCLSTTLSKVHIDGIRMYADDSALPPCNDFYGMAPSLFEFRNLTVLNINDDLSFTGMDDHFLAEASVAWPKLQILKFAVTDGGAESKLRAETQVSLNGIASLARCRSLREISIPFDSSQPVLPFKDRRQDCLRSMKFAMSSLAGGIKVIEFLYHVFPGMENIEAYNDHNDDAQKVSNTARWSKIRWHFRMVLQLQGKVRVEDSD